MGRSAPSQSALAFGDEIRIALADARMEGILEIPPHAQGLVIFAHGSGSSRHSRRNRRVAEMLQSAGLATLLFDLLTPEEERVDAVTAHLRFDIDFLATRLRDVTRWASSDERTAVLRIGYFGASTGAAAALVAAAVPESPVAAIVSRGGRPDLAGDALRHVRAPTLLIVGAADDPVISFNQRAYEQLPGPKRLEIIPRATHLFEEPGALEMVAQLASRWFGEHLPAQGWHP